MYTVAIPMLRPHGSQEQVVAATEMSIVVVVPKPVTQVSMQRDRINLLAQAGQNDAVFEARKKMAADYPHDANVQVAFAYALVNLKSDYESALKHLKLALENAERWSQAQEAQVRVTYLSYLDSLGRHKEALAFIREWVESERNGQAPFGRYLSALLAAVTRGKRIYRGEEERRVQLLRCAKGERPEDYIAADAESAGGPMRGDWEFVRLSLAS